MHSELAPIDWLDLTARSKTISAFPKGASWTRLTLRIVDAFLMRTAKNLLHHNKGAHLMLTQSGEHTFLNVYLIAGIGIVAEVSMNDRVTIIAQENAQDSFACPRIVGTIKREGRPRKSGIALLCEPSQSRDWLSHRLGLTTQAQRRWPRDAPIATATARRRSLQRMVESNPKRVERPAEGAFYNNHALVSLGYWRVIWDE